MKLGVSYNVFDGEELLEGSIKQIRSEVDYISVVYQTVSNFGNKCDDNLIPFLEDLKNRNLIDEIYEYKPTVHNGGGNEINKRNIGLELSKKNGCTHHMSMDTDEYYQTEQFSNLKNIIKNYGFDSSYCQMKSYYKTWEYQLDPPEEYYVSLIFEIKEDSKYTPGLPAPVLVDPTRKMSNRTKPVVFKRTDIEMHHGSYIRNDISKKLINSSAKNIYVKDIDKLINHYTNWEFPNKVLWAGNPIKTLTVKKVDNLFI
jgi:hypothetical protein